MGAEHSAFSEQELDDYEDLTYLTKKEILHVHRKFASLDQDAVSSNRNAMLPFDTIAFLPQLTRNPFKERIMNVFSTSGDGMTFDDFLDMMSAFSEHAPRLVKATYAFRIYDFDGDDILSTSDLEEVINRLTGDENRLDVEQMKHLINNILQEADMDGDGQLSFVEFEHIISKCSDFTSSFKIRL